MIDAIVLAGAANTGPLRTVSTVKYEAMIPINGRPMLLYVLVALLRSRKIGNILVVGPEELASVQSDLPADDAGRVQFVPSGDSILDNLLRGLDAVGKKDRVLVVTSDVPLLTSDAVDDFIERCHATEADVYYPIISKEVSAAKYPDAERTYVNLKEGTFTGGNLALVNPEALSRGRRVMEQAFQMRKKPVKLARLLGFRFILKFGMRRLSLPEIEERAAEILGYRGIAVPSPYPEIGLDVDKPSDIQIVERALQEGSDSSQVAEN